MKMRFALQVKAENEMKKFEMYYLNSNEKTQKAKVFPKENIDYDKIQKVLA